MTHRFYRFLVFVVMYFTLAACGGGGCGGGTITPIRGGFPIPPRAMADRRIPHAVQIRISDQGLRSIETIGPSLLAGFLGSGINVPQSMQNAGLCTAVICSSGTCTINVRLADTRPFQLGFLPPDKIRAQIRIVLQSVGPNHIPIRCGILSTTLNIDTTRGARPHIGLETAIALRRDTHVERLGYTRADLAPVMAGGETVAEIMGEGIEDADITFSGVIGAILGLFRGQLIGLIRGQLTNALGPLQSALAATSMPDPPGCPAGTTADGSNCLYPGGQPRDQRLVPMLIGMDGEGNFGKLLSSVTPGIRAPNQMLLAAGDPTRANAEITATGGTINMYGAMVSGRQASCVPMMATPALPTVPEFTTLRNNVIPGTMTTTDMGIGISEGYLNSTLWNLWNSGMFCLGITSRLSQQVSAGLLGALPGLQNLRTVYHPSTNAALAIAFRPQQPPTAIIGSGADINTDPLIGLQFRQLALDFYIWSEERYVRIFTLTSDLTIPINLTVAMAGLQPQLGMVKVENPVVSNVALINTMPDQLAELLQGLLGTVISQFAGSLPAVNLPTIPLPGAGGAMIAIEIPAGGVKGVTDSGSKYIGLFANLRCRGGMCPMRDTLSINATVQAEVLPFDGAVLQFNGQFSPERAPAVRLNMGAANSFGRPAEFRYRIDNGAWSAWTAQAVQEIRHPMLNNQGRHTIDVVARMVNEVMTESVTPASTSIVIDASAPTLSVERRGNVLIIDAHDAVTEAAQLEYQVSWDGHAVSTWERNVTQMVVPNDARNIRVRVRDESGRVSEQLLAAAPRTIRGGASTELSGCGCTTPGQQSNKSNAALGALALGVGMALRRRRRERTTASKKPVFTRLKSAASAVTRKYVSAQSLMFWGVLTLFFTGLGCNCGDGNNAGNDGGREGGVVTDRPTPDSGPPMCMDGAQACASMGGRCIPQPECPVCEPGSMATGTPVFDAATCMWRTTGEGACGCMPLPPLAQGMAGSHLDMATAVDGTVWLSSYSAGDPFSRRADGDLVVGRWNMQASRVDWQIVDGVPADGMIGGDVRGWRRGIITPGPDVGRWNSIALNAMGFPMVSYWDTTADKLKFAVMTGTLEAPTWTIHVVDPNGHNGRYSSMALLPGGIPMIAYRATVTDAMGAVSTEVRVARAASANPTRAMDWTITRVFNAPTRCRASDCAAGQTCTVDGACITPAANCMPACAMGKTCVAGMCKDTVSASYVDDFAPGALFMSLALDPMGRGGLVFYNRDRGNLMASAFDGTMWAMPSILTGEMGMTDEGDFGAWCSLVIGGDGVWHVSYVDAYEEGVMYARVQNGRLMGAPEVVDSGNAAGGATFADGKHIIGDSIQLSLDAMGNPRLVYQDSSQGTLRLATRGAMGMWTNTVLDMVNHTGYWARIEGQTVATFYRDMRTATPIANRFGVRVTRLP
jgi:MYXO-CTERM domain-containing protein